MPTLNFGDLTITSPAFEHTGRIPDQYSMAGGDNIPELNWTGVPAGTKELAIMVHDPDAPLTDGFTHWIAVGIDPSANGIGGDLVTEFIPGINSMGDPAYMGPAPPGGHGTHHYFFHLYALDTTIAHDPAPDRDALLAAIDGHIIEQARVVGTWSVD